MKVQITTTALLTMLNVASCGSPEKKDSADEASTPSTQPATSSKSDPLSQAASSVSNKLNFACFEDQDPRGAFVPPMKHTQLNVSNSANPKDLNCNPLVDSTCNPGGAIGGIGGFCMFKENLCHIIPTTHTYNSLKTNSVSEIFNMAKAHVTRVDRTKQNEYAIFFLNSCSLISYYGHLSYLVHPELTAALDEVKPNWKQAGSEWTIQFGASTEREQFGVLYSSKVIVLEQGDKIAHKDPAVLNTALDVGVLDKRVKKLPVYADPRTYLLREEAFGTINYSMHSAHFIQYLSDENKALYARYLDFAPAFKPPFVAIEDVNYGKSILDVAGTLEGMWFNPLVYSEENPLGSRDNAESAALSITRTLAASASVYFVHATKENSSKTAFQSKLPQIDPALWDACGCDQSQNSCVESCLLNQKRLSSYTSKYHLNQFPISDISSSGVNYNLDPKSVTPATGVVCYDVYVRPDNKYDQFYIQMVSANEIHLKFYPTNSATKQCPTRPVVDMTSNYHTFVRSK